MTENGQNEKKRRLIYPFRMDQIRIGKLRRSMNTKRAFVFKDPEVAEAMSTHSCQTDLQKYHDSCFSRSGVNRLWILKNSKDLLETLSSRSQYVCNSIKTFDFSTIYTTILHTLLKSRIK